MYLKWSSVVKEMARRHFLEKEPRFNGITWLLLLIRTIRRASFFLAQTRLWVVNTLLSSITSLEVSIGHF